MSQNLKLKKAVEAILFMVGSPVSLAELSRALEADQEQIGQAIVELQKEFENHGLIITENNESYQMVTSPEVSGVVKNYIQAQLREKLTEAAIETLTIITYRQPVSKTEIEAIRGVNSQYILKLLMQRGLAEHVPSQTDARVLLYQTTHELLHHLGIKNLKELPNFEEIKNNMTLSQSQTE